MTLQQMNLSKEFPRNIETLIKELHLRFQKKNPLDFHASRNRNVFLFKNHVVKIPSSPLGMLDNEWEGSVSTSPEYIDDPKWIQYPKTRLFYWKGIPVLFMERLEIGVVEGKGYHELPDWVMSVDGGQVGYNRQGRLLAYDYGLY